MMLTQPAAEEGSHFDLARWEKELQRRSEDAQRRLELWNGLDPEIQIHLKELGVE